MSELNLKPHRNVGAWYKFKKTIIPENWSERHQAVGWCLGTLVNTHGRSLLNIKSLNMLNDEDGVRVEAILYLSLTTIQDDYIADLDRYAQLHTGTDCEAFGYCTSRKFWSWDSVERIGDVDGHELICGSPGGILMVGGTDD